MKLASLPQRVLAALIDLGWLAACAAFAILAWNAPAYPSWETGLKIAALAVPLWALQVMVLGATFGARALRMLYLDPAANPYAATERLLPVALRRARLWRTEPLGGLRATTVALLVIASFLTEGGVAVV